LRERLKKPLKADREERSLKTERKKTRYPDAIEKEDCSTDRQEEASLESVLQQKTVGDLKRFQEPVVKSSQKKIEGNATAAVRGESSLPRPSNCEPLINVKIAGKSFLDLLDSGATGCLGSDRLIKHLENKNIKIKKTPKQLRLAAGYGQMYGEATVKVAWPAGEK
jgi:hypothetical protein